MVDGQRDIAYSDLDTPLPRATEDGEQVQLEIPEEEEVPPTEVPLDSIIPAGRPAGKLYGKSLIDDLESRKAAMKSKQRYVSMSSLLTVC